MSDTNEKTEIKFNQEHYDLLKECSDKNDMAEWNEFVKYFGRDKVISLEGADLKDTHLQNADLNYAHLEGAEFHNAHLEGAKLKHAHLEASRLLMTHLEGADLKYSHLEHAYLHWAHLEATKLNFSTCDGATKYDRCYLDMETDLREIALDNIQWSPGLKQLAEYNNRRLNWIDWYKKHRIAKYPVRFFWECSDYGRSTQRILWTFTGLSLLFAGVYFMNPEILTGLKSMEENPLAQRLYGCSLFWRSLYFSVVTMTTLGFGDIHADFQSPLGHGLLMLQVIIGYVILGALVTRLSILFNSDGPSADFAKTDSPKSWISRWKDGWGEGSTNL